MTFGAFGILWDLADAKGRAHLLHEARQRRRLWGCYVLFLLALPWAIWTIGVQLWQWTGVGPGWKLVVCWAVGFAVLVVDGALKYRRWDAWVKEIGPAVTLDRIRQETYATSMGVPQVKNTPPPPKGVRQ